MPDAVAPAAPAPAAGTGQPAQPQQGSFLATILRMAFMWWLMSWFKGGQNNTAKQVRTPARLHARVHGPLLVPLSPATSRQPGSHSVGQDSVPAGHSAGG